MSLVKKFILLSILLILSFQANAEKEEAESSADLVTQIMTAFMKENNIPGAAVEIYVDGKPRSYYFGYANQEKQTSVTKNTIFEVGSISKILTSLLLAQSVDAAKVQLTDPITKFMPGLPEDKFKNVSLRSLATYTSGLPFNTPDSIKDQTELQNYFKGAALSYSADDKWIYSNVGIGMLGMALESATHQNYNQLYRTQILTPLKMQPIALVVPKKLEQFYAQGYGNNDEPVKPAELGLFPTAYGIKLSGSDMQNFLSAAIGLPGAPDKIFYPMRLTQTAFVRLSDRSQGLGWQIHSLRPDRISSLLQAAQPISLQPLSIVEVLEKPIYNGYALIDKTGTTNGFRAYIAVIPERKSGIAIMINKNIPNNKLVDSARKILLTLAKVNDDEDEEEIKS